MPTTNEIGSIRSVRSKHQTQELDRKKSTSARRLSVSVSGRSLHEPGIDFVLNLPIESVSEPKLGAALGKHLLIDCRNVAREVCLDDKRMLNAMARGAEEAGANVISQVRYRFGADSPPGFTIAVLLDESHCTAHSYADQGLIALDIFTCGQVDPRRVLEQILNCVDLGDVTITEMARFSRPTERLNEPGRQTTDPQFEIHTISI